MLDLLSLAAGLASGLATVPPCEKTRIDYSVEYLEGERSFWRVSIKARGLDPKARDLRLFLSGWGEWCEQSADYLQNLSIDLPYELSEASDWSARLQPPDAWNGALSVDYEIVVANYDSKLREAHGLMPWSRGGFCRGFSTNTLMRVRAGDSSLEAEREIRLAAPEGMWVATGWQGLTRGKQVLLRNVEIDNSVILFGRNPEQDFRDEAGVHVEVTQFGVERRITASVLPMVFDLTQAYGRTTGKPVDHPVRVFVIEEPGGGTRTDHGLLVSFESQEEGREHSPYFKGLVAHEMFHDWLGGYLQPEEESLIWFYEGFTEYLALWHLVHTGHLDADWFVQRLQELDQSARTRTSLGKIAFADPSVQWRDGDGPNETMAYHGAPILAFMIDVELRQVGHPGLPELLEHLLQQNGGRYSLSAIRSWLQDHDLGAFYARHVEGLGLPPLEDSLKSAGFVPVRVPEVLTYFGIESSAGTDYGTIRAIDPSGPCARLDVAVGDVITGYYPTREVSPVISKEITTRYRFGLDRFAPNHKGTFFGIRRGDREIKIEVEPQVIAGGDREQYQVTKQGLAFFEYSGR